MARPRTRVAVLGGGVGAIAAAFELTAPELAGQYDVTVYQPGWRLGGKCASGRRPPHHRIEEHGLHVWFGFYANAFDLMKRCYAEWNPPAGHPLRTWDQAFKPCNDIVLFESWRGKWTPWHLHLPPNDAVPGTREEPTFWGFVRGTIEYLLSEWRAVRDKHADQIPPAAHESARRLHVPVLGMVLDTLGRAKEEFDHETAAVFPEVALEVARKCEHAPAPAGAAASQHHEHVAHLLERFKRWLFDELLEPLIDNADIRRYAILLDLWTTTICGMAADRVLERGFGPLNDEDLRAWLRRHGAERLTLGHAAVIKGLYDLVFAYRDGDKQRPDLAAGKALQAMIRIVFEYQGAVLWKMQAGMGDTVLTPFYEVLLERGVHFRFFHQVVRLGVCADGKSISTIEVQPQVRLKRGSYKPLVPVLELDCWPSEPDWHQLEDADELRARGVNFEQECNPLGLQSITLKAGEDFDQVVLGIPTGALPPLCEELAAASEAFKQMLDHSDAVMTEGIQLWLTRKASELGWAFEDSIATSYVNAADTYSNMSQLLPRETWPAGSEAADVVYLCGVIKHDGVRTQADADARVRENALAFLERDANRLWPAGCERGSFEFDLLADGSGSGAARVDAQFLRANFQGTERYVMTRAGSVKYRLRADQSGFENLKLAGDWTRNGIDGGSVEAAVTSGMQAARAISGSPKKIQGERGWLVDDD